MLKVIRHVGAAIVLCAASLAWAQAPEKPDVHIAVGGKAALYYLPLTITEQLGYFKDEGLNVKISDFKGGSAALRAVVGGSADVVSGAYEHTINMQARGQKFEAFVLQGRAPQISIGVSTAKVPNYKSPKDLKGLKIGVSAPGSSTNMFADYVLEKGGLGPKDVSFVGVGTGSAAIAAIQNGQVDAISNVDPVMTMLEKQGAVKVIFDVAHSARHRRRLWWTNARSEPLCSGRVRAEESEDRTGARKRSGAGAALARQCHSTADSRDGARGIPAR